jgi:hypothetical protein
LNKVFIQTLTHSTPQSLNNLVVLKHDINEVFGELSITNESITKSSIPGDAVYDVMRTRIKAAMMGATNPFIVPKLRPRVEKLAADFLRLVHLNRVVHTPTYNRIIAGVLRG